MWIKDQCLMDLKVKNDNKRHEKMLITCQINFDVSFIQFFGTFKNKRPRTQKEVLAPLAPVKNT